MWKGAAPSPKIRPFTVASFTDDKLRGFDPGLINKLVFPGWRWLIANARIRVRLVETKSPFQAECCSMTGTEGPEGRHAQLHILGVCERHGRRTRRPCVSVLRVAGASASPSSHWPSSSAPHRTQRSMSPPTLLRGSAHGPQELQSMSGGVCAARQRVNDIQV